MRIKFLLSVNDIVGGGRGLREKLDLDPHPSFGKGILALDIISHMWKESQKRLGAIF